VPKRESAPIGAPIWIDLFSSDPAKSRGFYEELMGWTATEPEQQFGGYFSFLKGDSLVAGGMKNVGTAGVPAGSIPVVALILGLVGVPVEGIGLILGVDRFLDMCRTTLNVTGDLAAAVVVSRGEGPAVPAPEPAT